jgi:hypothetical protein
VLYLPRCSVKVPGSPPADKDKDGSDDKKKKEAEDNDATDESDDDMPWQRAGRRLVVLYLPRCSVEFQGRRPMVSGRQAHELWTMRVAAPGQRRYLLGESCQ